MVDSTDHRSGKTGLNISTGITMQIAQWNGSTWQWNGNNGLGRTMYELAYGWYAVNLTTSDTATLGDLTFRFTATGCDPANYTDQVIDYLPADCLKLNGALLNGNNAVLRLKAIDVQNADTGVTGGAQGTSGHAVYIVSHGYDGINIVGPTGGVNASSTNGNGASFSGSGGGSGMYLYSNLQHGLNISGRNTGIQVVGYPGLGVSITGWTDGLYVEGTVNGISCEGETNGLKCFGGSGILATGWSGKAPGHGLNCVAVDSGVPVNGGVVLSSTGLNNISITAPTGPATNFREMMVQLWRRFFKKTTLDATNIKTYADNGSTIVTTQTASESAGVQTQGPAT